ncbi:nuclear transport factor 2 family protein [Mycolicibacterium sp. S2-37]|uniref:nuclear transport factor 2 family protein n=1 Tax=Mycolicibacterium sp. S2-37 TaxID=2810297 RepID=UPI001A93D7E4|nr:nuclear transport factor 2 family protein [Mycolicibacterium sp. S2-37]MBO0680950.1 nuclear transport factor 2 family protein [Mycolicibacterium sp. S2-37]
MGKWSTRVVGLVATLCAAAFVALAGVGGWLYWERVEIRGAQDARAALEPLAAEQMPKVFGYDYQTVERSLTEAYNLLTPDFRQEFRDRATKDIIPQARQRQLVSQAHVVGVGIMSAQRDSAQVMVYLNRTVTEKGGEPIYDGSRLRVDYTKVDGKWLIGYIAPI